MGPNGAGKTTFFNCTSGVVRPDRRQAISDDEDVTEHSAEVLAERSRRVEARSHGSTHLPSEHCRQSPSRTDDDRVHS